MRATTTTTHLLLAMTLSLALTSPSAAETKPTKPAPVKVSKTIKPAAKASAKKPKPSMTKIPAFAEDIQCVAPAQRVITHREKETTVECRVADKSGAFVHNHGPWLGKRDGDTHPHTRGYYKAKQKAGEWLYYFPNSGKIWIKGNWENDKGVGTWYVYEEDGDLSFKGAWPAFEQYRKKDTPNGGDWTLWLNK